MSQDLLLSNIENTETLLEQTITKPQKALENNLTKHVDTFKINISFSFEEGEQMLALINLGVYNSVFFYLQRKYPF